MNEWDRWRQKLGHRYCLVAPCTVRHDFRRKTCGPSSFATVELLFEPSSALAFARECEWPAHLKSSETRDLDAAIAAGIHDALQPTEGTPYDALGVIARCVRVQWDDVGSSEAAFYTAAWCATRELREVGKWQLKVLG